MLLRYELPVKDGRFDADRFDRVARMSMKPHVPSISFAAKHEEISKAASGVQEAFRRLVGSLLPHEPSGRSFARAFGLDKTLGWQIHRVATAPDAATVLAAMPGRRGVAIFLEAVGTREADPALVDGARRAVESLEEVSRRLGVSPREMRAIAAGGLDSEAQRQHLAKALKSQYDSSVVIRGECVSTLAVTYLVVPSRRDPTLVTLVVMAFQAGLRTVRPLGPRVVYRGVTSWRDHAAWESQDMNPEDLGRFPALVPAACSDRIERAGLRTERTGDGWFVLADPDLHPAKSLTLGFCETIEEIGSVHATLSSRAAELSMLVAAPTRHVVLEVLFERSLPHVEPNPAIFFGSINRTERVDYRELRRFGGDFRGGFTSSPRPPIASREDADRYAKLLSHGMSLVGRTVDDFHCYRAHMPYPPTMTEAVVRWILPEPPKAEPAPRRGRKR